MRVEAIQLGEKLIVVEGGSGVGKTTALNGIQERLTGEEWKFWREPGGTILGEKMREAVQGHTDEEYPVDPYAAFMAYGASRANLINIEVIPWLEKGGYGLLDRFWYSTYAYQGGGEGIDKEFIRMINLRITHGLEPGLVICFDLLPEIAEERKVNKTDLDRYDRMPREFQERVRDSYLELAEQNKDTWRVIDASQSPEKVLLDTLAALCEFGFVESVEIHNGR